MKTILLLSKSEDISHPTPPLSDIQKQIYSIWGHICKEYNVSLLRAPMTVFKDGVFTQYWQFQSGNWSRVDDSPISPSIIYDSNSENFSADESFTHFDYSIIEQKKYIASFVPFMNSPEFTELLRNKLVHALIFQDYLPKSRFVPKHTNVINQSSLPLVLKNLVGSGGKSVDITYESSIHSHKQLAQRPLFSQNGSLKDIRITFIGDIPQYAFYRFAPQNSWYTNVTQGGSIELADFTDIPDILAYAKEIATFLDIFPYKIFSIDLLLDTDNSPLGLMEINTCPRVTKLCKEHPEVLHSYFHRLTDYLLTIANTDSITWE